MQPLEDCGELPKVKLEARTKSKRRDNSIMSVKGKNEDISSPTIKEDEDDMCSLMECSGGSEEYEPFPALRVREMSFIDGEDIEEDERREQASVLSMGHCKARKGTDHGCILDTEETKGGKHKEQKSEVECGEGRVLGHMNDVRRVNVSDMPLDHNSCNGFLLATGAWELGDEVDQNRNHERQLLDIESSDDEEVMREKASYSQYLDPEKSSGKDQEASFQTMSKWAKERNKVDEEFCSLLLEIGRLDAKIEYLTVANIALDSN